MDMRDINRIKPLIHRLEQLWLQNPDFRLGQLVMVIARTGEVNPELFNMEDDVMLSKLEEIEEILRNAKNQ